MVDSNWSPSCMLLYSVDRACSRTKRGFCGTLAALASRRATWPLTLIVTAVGVHSAQTAVLFLSFPMFVPSSSW